MRTITLLAFACTLLLTSCDLVSGPRGNGLEVGAVPPNLHLKNATDRPIYFFAVEESMSARILWAPCTQPESCPRVGARTTREFPYDLVAGYSPGATTALIYWWHLEPVGDGSYEPDRVRLVTTGF